MAPRDNCVSYLSSTVAIPIAYHGTTLQLCSIPIADNCVVHPSPNVDTHLQKPCHTSIHATTMSEPIRYPRHSRVYKPHQPTKALTGDFSGTPLYSAKRGSHSMPNKAHFTIRHMSFEAQTFHANQVP